MSKRLNVAIAHDYLTQRGGAEKVVLAMARAFPNAPIYTTLYDPDSTYPEFRNLDVRVTPLNKIKYFRQHHRAALPLLPFFASSTYIDADVVLTSSSGWAHGFRTNGRKVVYCYSPARWLYQPDTYLGDNSSVATRLLLQGLSPLLRMWDRKAAQTADRYIAISTVVKHRIQRAYGITSVVVPAPQLLDVNLESAPVVALDDWAAHGYYLCVSRLLPYKNVDKIVAAFEGSANRLVVVGSGPEEDSLRELAGTNVKMVKNLTDQQIRWVYQHSTALVAASYEDFGLTPLEAAAYGKPSAVLRWGGFLDTVVEGVTGVFFDEPDPQDISDALDALAKTEWSTDALVSHLDRFSESRFAQSLADAVEETLACITSSEDAEIQKEMNL